jgi:hypothetical protein
MASKITDSFATLGTLTITLGTLATSTVGVGRQSTMVDNTTLLNSAAQIAIRTTAGTSTGTNLISVYLIRSDNSATRDDAAGASDAAWTQLNAPLLGNIVVGAGTNLAYQAVFDTTFLGHLGPQWGIGVVHNLGNPLNATAGSHLVTYTGIIGSIV